MKQFRMRRYISGHRKGILIVGGCLTIGLVGSFWSITHVLREPSSNATADTHTSANSPASTEPEPASAAAQPTTPAAPATPPLVSPKPVTTYPVTLTTEQAASLTVVVNKKHKLPSTYVPADLTSIAGGQLRAEAANALSSLLNAAAASGVPMKLISSYRSYSYQEQLYASYVARDGQAAADTYSARAGHSEHQTGLAADVGNGTCDLEICFGSTSAGKWLAANAQNYGFIIRYPAGKETDTGYSYEPWHLRYLGTATAQAVYASGKTLDQYYNIPAGSY